MKETHESDVAVIQLRSNTDMDEVHAFSRYKVIATTLKALESSNGLKKAIIIEYSVEFLRNHPTN